jgi:DNA polymerase III epsilon subunit-like protein
VPAALETLVSPSPKRFVKIKPLIPKPLHIAKCLRKHLGRYHCILDTETTDKASNHVYKRNIDSFDYEKEPHMTQFSCVIWDNHENPPQIVYTINDYCKLPTGVTISEDAKRVTGITEEMCEKIGIDPCIVLQKFLQLCKTYDISWFIAHNMDFDKKIIEINLKRYQLPYHGLLIHDVSDAYHYNKPPNTYCTMITNSRTNLKSVYEQMFNQPVPNGLHNSMIDVLVCLRCYLKRRFDTDIENEVFNALCV